MEVHKRERMQISFDMSKPSHAAVFHWLKNTNEPRTEIVVTAITDYIKKSEDAGAVNVSDSNLTTSTSFDYDLIVAKIESSLQNSMQNHKSENRGQDQSLSPEQTKKVFEQALYEILPRMIQAAFKNVIGQVMIPQIEQTVTGTINKAIKDSQIQNNSSNFNFDNSQLSNNSNSGSSFNFNENQASSSEYQQMDSDSSDDNTDFSEMLADASAFG